MFLKKHKRSDIPEANVVYILTTEDNKKKRTYIIGKAKNLKSRLSFYNKTAEHEIVYYKECKDEFS
jgi:excinuclease UvrABC nuclease subunit